MNKIKCLACGKILESTYRHDYKVCGCSNHASTDGGNDYQIYGAVDFTKIQVMGKKGLWHNVDDRFAKKSVLKKILLLLKGCVK